MPQGAVLGPSSSSFFINDLPPRVSNSIVRLFADDVAIYHPVSSIADAKLLQAVKRISTLYSYGKKSGRCPGKCKVMRFSRAIDKIDYAYNIRGHTLEAMKSTWVLNWTTSCHGMPTLTLSPGKLGENWASLEGI